MKNRKILFAILIIFAIGAATGLVVFINRMDFYPADSIQNSVKTPSGKNQNGAPSKKVPPKRDVGICRDLCGNGKCEEVVCLGENCPCPETPKSCPADCNKTPIPPIPGEPCVNLCGNGKCESEFNCEGSECPCFEDELTCPADCELK